MIRHNLCPALIENEYLEKGILTGVFDAIYRSYFSTLSDLNAYGLTKF